MPLARTAGTSVRQGADDAVAWATPKVDAARSWAAPQLEQSARAISENLAPMISSALITAAHKIEVPKRKAAPSAAGWLRRLDAARRGWQAWQRPSSCGCVSKPMSFSGASAVAARIDRARTRQRAQRGGNGHWLRD